MSTWIKPRGGPSHRPSPDGSSYATAEYNVPSASLPSILSTRQDLERDRSPLGAERVDPYRTQEVLEYYGGYTEPYSTEDYNYTWSEDSCRQEDSRRDELYQQFYREIEDDYNKEKHADCVVIALSKQQGDYAKLVGRRVQELGLLVDLVYLKLELALDTALKDVREEGSPFCVVVGGEHQSLSSCTVIILYAGHKEHRNMPLEDALDLISREHQRIFGETLEKERLEIAHKAANLADDYLHRESYDESHVVPSSIRHLLFLLGDGKHLYAEELQKVVDYLNKRKEALEGEANSNWQNYQEGGTELYQWPHDPSLAQQPTGTEGYYDVGSVPQPSSKPKPLLPTPGRPPLLGHAPLAQKKPPLLGDRPIRALLPAPGHPLKLGARLQLQ
ncbi:nuclear receptor coactivator 5-like isoform X1 [Chiloscyllium plagiosum]|uniref:nuclear receptor coactivator 5-like n=1 Tax=Hemiscyllium ocellatum TaxID=170820 RepID=UPI001CB7F2A0|nr:nuclear receptor coactivator 5-like isoform X1 [Chiloscyllium plagiosum]XP_043562876.1 nuclear receptor coactivator 5-like isoform X1 [Chiloscyllium plagiosum]XP_060693687.1 nuclear receptor coactivator 5-like [Hemiscyllium ocellatum]